MKRIALVALCLAGLALVPAILPGYNTTLVTEMLIFATLAMSIDILAGYSGRTPLCHGAIFGVATYVVLYYVTVEGGNVWVAVALGIAAATLTGAIFAVLAIRTSGVYFILLTLALGMIVWGICLRWTSVTGGENGIRGSVKLDWMTNQGTFYYFVLAVTAVMTLAHVALRELALRPHPARHQARASRACARWATTCRCICSSASPSRASSPAWPVRSTRSTTAS